MIKLIAGLGNPGERYAGNRHNIGFRAIDKLLEISPAKRVFSRTHATLFETEEFGLLCKPLTYMNRSGIAIAAVCRELDLNPFQVLVLYDDFALQLGMIRIRPHGSSGGHNGIQSMIDSLGSSQIPRVRLGIQTDEMDSWVDFVLSDFKRSEREEVAEMLDSCSEAVSVVLKEGITKAMNQFNKKQMP